jgi:hypothetical protein
MPPFAGQGMCAGIRDAVNLAWKLDLVLDGRAEPVLLASYDEERRPSARAAVDFSIDLGKVICVPDPTEAALRDEAMTAAYDGGLSPAPGLPGITDGVIQTGTALAGQLFPQGHLDGRPFDDVHGAGWRLVTTEDAAGELDADLVKWFAGIGGAVIDVTGTSEDLTAWFEANDVRWALQRPDFHLYGTAPDRPGAADLLTDLRHRLTPSAAPSTLRSAS